MPGVKCSSSTPAAGSPAQAGVGGKLGLVPLHVQQVFGGGAHLEAGGGVGQHGIEQEVASGPDAAVVVGRAAVDVAVAQAGAQALGGFVGEAADAGEGGRQRNVVLASAGASSWRPWL